MIDGSWKAPGIKKVS